MNKKIKRFVLRFCIKIFVFGHPVFYLTQDTQLCADEDLFRMLPPKGTAFTTHVSINTCELWTLFSHVSSKDKNTF